MYYGKHVPSALFGHHGYLQQLRAYSLVRKDVPKHLVDIVACIDDAINAIEPRQAREVIINIYRNGRTFKETQFDLGYTLASVTSYHALGVSEFGYRIDWGMGNHELAFGDDGTMVVTSPNAVEPLQGTPLPAKDVKEDYLALLPLDSIQLALKEKHRLPLRSEVNRMTIEQLVEESAKDDH